MSTRIATRGSPALHQEPRPAGKDMKAIVQYTYGSADVLELRDIDIPVVGGADVLVRVRAAGCGPDVWHLMTGMPYMARLAIGFRRPKVAVRGWDVAGIVEAIGANVTGFQPGDEVMGSAQGGSFAELALTQPDKLVPKPTNLTFEGAAAVPISGTTALRAVRDEGKVQPGQTVLVIGAAGGVGSLAVQIAKASGAVVTGVCSTSKMDLVRSVGADDAIDHTREDFTEGTRRWDVIIDTAGSPSAVTTASRPRTERDPRDRGWRRGWTLDGRLLPRRAPSAGGVPVRGSEASRAELQSEAGGPRRPEGAHRGREGHTGDRQHLSVGRRPGGHPTPRRGARPRQDRHNCLRNGPSLERRSR